MFNYYIYKVTDKVTGQFYIGSQCTGKIIGVDYFTSSYNEEFKSKFKSDPSLFDIKIIGVLLDADTCVREENNIIYNNMFILDELGNKKRNPLCLNEHCIRFGKNNFSTIGKHHSEEVIKKISEAKKGNKSWLGKHHSEEWKRKRSEALKGHIVSEEIRKKISNAKKGQVTWNKGKINVYSKDTIEKMRIARIGKSHIVSDETKQKISRANKGRRHTVEEIEKMRGIRKDKKCIICVETDIIYKSIREAEHILNINHSSILRCCQGKQHLAGGYHWKYFEVGK